MNFEEFLKKDGPVTENDTVETEEVSEADETENVELSVQKAVVESLAADKAEQEEAIQKLRASEEVLQKELENQRQEVEKQTQEIEKQKQANENLRQRIAELENELSREKERQFDMQERNPNALALLDRDAELPDRFPGETRDHVIEVLREARDQAEKNNRLRRMQILESVLVANEASGNLAEKRAELQNLFAENQNILSGPVIDELTRMGISYKNGEEYLLVDEIIKRSF